MMKKPTTSSRTATGVTTQQQQAAVRVQRHIKEMSEQMAFALGKVLKDFGFTVPGNIIDLDDFSHMKFKEMEFVAVKWENFSGLPPRNAWDNIFRFVTDHGGVLIGDPSSHMTVIVDTRMSPEAIEELAEMLEGHPTESVKMRVLSD